MSTTTAATYTALALALSWATYQHLTVRELRRSRVRQRRQLNKHARALIQLQGLLPYLPTSNGQPMNGKVWSGQLGPVVTQVTATIPGDASLQPHTTPDPPEPCPDAETVRLPELPVVRPTLEQVLAGATRGLTPTELADRIDCMVWDLLPELDRLVRDGKVQTVPSHTAGRTAYRLTDDTERLARMPVLPGVRP